MFVRIIEMVQEGSGFVPSGDEILMEQDSPLFQTLGDEGRRGAQMGYVAMSTTMFQQLKAIVKETASGQIAAPAG